MLLKWTNKKRSFSGSVTNLIEEKFTAHISKEDCVNFFNLCASLPQCLLKSEFERQTHNKYATIRAEEIHNEDLRKIQKYVEDNPKLTMEEATNIYYDVQGTGTPAMKYQRAIFWFLMTSIKI